MHVDHMGVLNDAPLPEHIEAIDARLKELITEDEQLDLEYQFRVIYTLDAAAKTRSHFEFLRPDSAEGKEIRNILVQYKAADYLYPHKPTGVVKLVQEKSGLVFTGNNHTQAWKLHKIRPARGAKQPENTNKEFCIYHAAHGDYTYSEAWVDRLTEEVKDAAKLAAIKSVKIGR